MAKSGYEQLRESGKQIYESMPKHMTARNEVTGSLLVSRPASDAYKDNYDRIFRNKGPEQDVNEVKEAVSTKISSDGERFVSNEVFMLTPEDMPPPKNVDMIIVTKWGKALIGHWDDEDCIEFFPLPRRARHKS